MELTLARFSHAIRLWTKMADLAMSDKAYATAAGLYVQAAKATLGNSTLRYTAKNHALKAAICHIADNEPAAARQVLENHSKVDRVFAERLEKTMLMKLAWTLTNRNTIGYETCLLRCRQERILSRFHLQILVEVKQAIVPDEEELVFA
jgi:alpha-soluble NSF attachment protein